MKGKVSGRVARVERKDDVTVLTLVGEDRAGREPHITQVRFPGRSAQQVADVTEGDAVLCEAELVYRQWKTATGEARAENTAQGLTCYHLEGGNVTHTGGYLALRHALCQYDLLAYVVRVEQPYTPGLHGGMRVRVWTKDTRGERHYYSVTFRGEMAEAVRGAQSGMILHLTVTARKVRRAGGGWADQVDALTANLCRSRVATTRTRTDDDTAPVTAPLPAAPSAAPAPVTGAPRPPAPVIVPMPIPTMPSPAPSGAPRPQVANITFTPAPLSAEDLQDLMPDTDAWADDVMEA